MAAECRQTISERHVKMMLQKKLAASRPRIKRVAHSAVRNVVAETMVFMDKYMDGYIHRHPSIGVTLK